MKYPQHRAAWTRWVATVASSLLFTAVLGCGGGVDGQSPPAPQSADNCSYAPEKRDADGKARLALLVGVGNYASASIADLAGPPADVANMKGILTGNGGYGFPDGNVCTLVDSQATGARFREAFAKALLQRAKPGDVVVVYFAGHGTRVPDNNGDESDMSDELLLFSDARTAVTGELRDDEFAELLKPLRKASGNVIVILDSCNSGTATRAGLTDVRVRFQAPIPEDFKAFEPPTSDSDESTQEFLDSGPD